MGWPSTEMPYSTSVPMTRRTLTWRDYDGGPPPPEEEVDAMGWWTDRVVPRLVDATLRGREIDELRSLVCEGLSGRVLEIGFGSGLNVRWYPATVLQVDVVEPSDLAWELSADRRTETSIPIERVGLDGERLASRTRRTTRRCRRSRSARSRTRRPPCGRYGGCSSPEGRCTSWSTASPGARSGCVAAPSGAGAAAGRRRLPPDPRPRAARRGRRSDGPDGRAGPLPGGPKPFTAGYLGEAVRA